MYINSRSVWRGLETQRQILYSEKQIRFLNQKFHENLTIRIESVIHFFKSKSLVNIGKRVHF